MPTATTRTPMNGATYVKRIDSSLISGPHVGPSGPQELEGHCQAEPVRPVGDEDEGQVADERQALLVGVEGDGEPGCDQRREHQSRLEHASAGQELLEREEQEWPDNGPAGE